jgi:hypothetical protein
MDIFLILIGGVVVSFIVGLLIILFWSNEDISTFSVFEITKTGFYSMSFVILIIVWIVLSLTV